MDKSHKTDRNYILFLAYIKSIYTHDYDLIAANIWNTYWDGIRDIRLADAGMWLIDRFGY